MDARAGNLTRKEPEEEGVGLGDGPGVGKEVKDEGVGLGDGPGDGKEVKDRAGIGDEDERVIGFGSAK